MLEVIGLALAGRADAYAEAARPAAPDAIQVASAATRQLHGCLTPTAAGQPLHLYLPP
jgi:hypothetical protein